MAERNTANMYAADEAAGDGRVSNRRKVYNWRWNISGAVTHHSPLLISVTSEVSHFDKSVLKDVAKPNTARAIFSVTFRCVAVRVDKNLHQC